MTSVKDIYNECTQQKTKCFQSKAAKLPNNKSANAAIHKKIAHISTQLTKNKADAKVKLEKAKSDAKENLQMAKSDAKEKLQKSSLTQRKSYKRSRRNK